MLTQNRFFSDLKKATSALKSMAVENKCTMYLYRIFYGPNDTPEFSVRFPNEILDPDSINIIDKFTPTPKPAIYE